MLHAIIRQAFNYVDCYMLPEIVIIVKPKQAGTCGRGIRNEHMTNH